MPDDAAQEALDPEVESAAQKLAHLTAATGAVSDDFNDAVVEDNEIQEWHVPTGRVDGNGSPKLLRVLVQMPRRPRGLLTAFLGAKDRKAATLSLWKALVVQPQQILQKGVHEKLSDVFVEGLNDRILLALGLDGFFLESRMRMLPPSTLRALKQSFTLSPVPTDKTPAPSPDGTSGGSSPPGSTTASSAPASASSSSPTSPSPSPAPSPSPTTAPVTPTPPSPSPP